MSKQKQKKKHPMLLPFALLLCAGALLGMLFLLQKDESAAPDDAGQTGRQTTLFSCAREDIASITITPPSGESYTLNARDGALSVPGESDFSIRSLIGENILSVICTVIAEDTVLDTSEKVTDLADFGLAPARVQASVVCQDGSVHTMRVGDEMQLGIPYRYFMWDDHPMIYAVSADVYDAFSYDFAALHDVEQPVWDHTLWDRVTVTGENERDIVRTDIGWQMNKPFVYPLDTTETESFLSSVENIAFANYVGDADQLDLSDYGLDMPRLTLTMEQASTIVAYYDDTGALTDSLVLPEEQITVTFGHQADDYYVYCMYLDTVYTATLFQTGFLWNEDVSSLLDRTPLDVPISALSRLTVTQDGTAKVYDISLTEQLEQNGDLKTDDEGNVLYDVHVKKDGTDMDTDTFLSWYASLQQCAPESAVPVTFAPTGSMLSITFEGENFTRTAAFMPLDALHTALCVDGSTRYYLADTALDTIKALP